MAFETNTEKLQRLGLVTDVLNTYLKNKTKERQALMPTQTKPTTLSYKGDVVQIDQFGNYKKVFTFPGAESATGETDYGQATNLNVEDFKKRYPNVDISNLEKMIDDDKDITKEDYGVYEGILADKKPPEKTKKQTKTYYNNLGRGQEVLFDPKEGTYTIGSKVYDSEAFNKLNLTPEEPGKGTFEMQYDELIKVGYQGDGRTKYNVERSKLGSQRLLEKILRSKEASPEELQKWINSNSFKNYIDRQVKYNKDNNLPVDIDIIKKDFLEETLQQLGIEFSL